MTVTFNLICEKWIPCITSAGKYEEFSLRGLFAMAHEIREISCETPIQSAAMMPLLLAILHRKFGPANTSEWGDLWYAGKFDMERLNEYFKEWHERFDLFHPERPFYQATADGTPPSSLIHIVHTSGRTATLFNHDNEFAGVRISPVEAAHQLLASRLFHTNGTGPTAGKGRGRLYFNDSPYARGVIFWMRGETLFKTLMLNLVRYFDDYPIPRTGQDMPSWEMAEPFKLRTKPYGYLDYLTWSNNRIKLFPEKDGECIYVRNATVVPTLALGQGILSPQKRHSHNTVTKGKETIYPPLCFTSEKALWRDYHTLLPRDDKSPAVIRWCSRLSQYGYLDKNHVIQLMATGMSTDPGKAKTNYYRREVMPIPFTLLHDKEKMVDITNAIVLAEEIAKILSSALHLLADRVMKKTLGESNPNNERNSRDIRQKLISQWNAADAKRYSPQLYWTRLEWEFENFVKGLRDDSDEAVDTWNKTLAKAAEESLNDAVRLAGNSPWALKGKVEADNQLNGGIKRLYEKKGIEFNDRYTEQ